MSEPSEKKRIYTREEYLAMESAAEYRSEYYGGEIFAMTGGSPNHSAICFNLNRRVGEALDGKNCRGFESNMKLEIAEADAYVYPDLMVVCDDVAVSEHTSDAITNPMLIIEVLSPGTEAFDRGRKFEYYQTLSSLKEYILVSQDRAKIESFVKQGENTWQYTVTEGLDNGLSIQSLGCEIALKDIYRQLDWAQQ